MKKIIILLFVIFILIICKRCNSLKNNKLLSEYEEQLTKISDSYNLKRNVHDSSIIEISIPCSMTPGNGSLAIDIAKNIYEGLILNSNSESNYNKIEIFFNSDIQEEREGFILFGDEKCIDITVRTDMVNIRDLSEAFPQINKLRVGYNYVEANDFNSFISINELVIERYVLPENEQKKFEKMFPECIIKNEEIGHTKPY